jgi:hypothetical protein
MSAARRSSRTVRRGWIRSIDIGQLVTVGRSCSRRAWRVAMRSSVSVQPHPAPLVVYAVQLAEREADDAVGIAGIL